MSADLPATLNDDNKNYASLPTMSSSEDEEDEHFVIGNQLRMRRNLEDRK